MSKPSLADDPELSLPVGGQSVGANLQRAVDAGFVVVNDDGTLQLATPALPARELTPDDYFIFHRGEFSKPCGFLNRFLFRHAYAQSAVPFGCRDCYKVKIVANNLRQLMAVKDILETTSYTAKTGMEAENGDNQHIYSSYLYNIGLDRARTVYKDMKKRIDAHDKLGSSVKMLIKRGCTNYERSCGPSDRYTFDPRLEAVETCLAKRFHDNTAKRSTLKKALHEHTRVFNMVGAAYRLGDDTYKDFIGGRTLYRPVVTYSPEAEDDEPAGSHS
jgi:hypothetical protein